MTGKKACAFAFGLLLCSCCALATGFTVLRMWPLSREPAVNTQQLLIDASAFPPGWYTAFDAEPIPKPEYGERESLHVGFGHEGLEPYRAGASHRVYRYRNELDAAIVYTLLFSGRGFPNHIMTTPWDVPEEWSYQSPIADHFRFECGELDSEPPEWICETVARYDEYVSVFGSELSPDYMTLEDVERILVAIDERMALHLGKDVE
jgi:hypothetical protein